VNANILLAFTSLGLSSGILFHASARDIAFRQLNRVIWYSGLFQLALVVLLETIHHSLYGKFWIWPTSRQIEGLMGVVFFLAISLAEKYYALYNGYHRFHIYNLITVIFSALLALLCGIIFVWGIYAEPATVIMVAIGVQALQTICIWAVFRWRRISLEGSSGREAIDSRFFRYSLYAFLSNALHFLVTRVDFWFLQYYQGEEQVGLYALASRIGQLFLVLPALVAGVILPSIAADPGARVPFERLFRGINTINILIMALLGVAAFLVVPLIFGLEFEGSVFPLLILLPGIFSLAGQTLMAAYFAAKGRPSVNTLSSFLTLLLVLILDLWLIPTKGAEGAAIASTIAYSLGFLFSYWKYCLSEKYPPGAILASLEDVAGIRTLIRSLNKSGENLWR
jgi:O-antigen/teichoic acid export membrane protein